MSKAGLQAVEDLRELPLSQWHEPLNLEDDWLAAVFGKDPADQAQASSSASSARPAIKDKVDSDDDDKSDGRQVAIAGQELEQLQPQEHDEEQPDGPAEHPGSLKPIFDFRRVFTRLPKLAGKDVMSLRRGSYLAYMNDFGMLAVRAYSPSCSAVECLMLSGA